ncbi:Coiled-coil domain-containing protein 25-like protein [Smittium culicis]|uniref:Coiled-coil domain-containing protein 25-like protein n=1 Tax=Smittium culicis TaxID=133412 RepID=A0A1R1XXQ2_9FUNG|nr:Coiled-coil domain-containing protein 25-like protein [Smittium culicis]
MGKDKFENEELIKYGFEEDVWFHVDNLSSAHVYLRMGEGMTWETIPQVLLDDLAQLTKANSIEGNKKDNVVVIYTPFTNLLKNQSMQTGAVSFKNPKKVKKVFVDTRVNSVVNRLNKTKEFKEVDLAKLKVQNDKAKLALVKKEQNEARQLKKKLAAEKLKNQENKSYQSVFKSSGMKSNKKGASVYEDVYAQDSDEYVSHNNNDFDDFM